MTSHTEYFDVLKNPSEKKIEQMLNTLSATAIMIEKDVDNANKLLSEYMTRGYSKRITHAQQLIKFKLDELKFIEHKMEKLLTVQQEFKKNKMLGPIICGICNLESEGLQILESPIKICLKCIYSAVLEHQTKNEWSTHKTIMSNGSKT